MTSGFEKPTAKAARSAKVREQESKSEAACYCFVSLGDLGGFAVLGQPTAKAARSAKVREQESKSEAACYSFASLGDLGGFAVLGEPTAKVAKIAKVKRKEQQTRSRFFSSHLFAPVAVQLLVSKSPRWGKASDGERA